MPIKEAFKPVFEAQLMFWNELTQFHEAFCGILQSVVDLEMNVEDFQAAFAEVDVNLNFNPETRSCVPVQNKTRKNKHTVKPVYYSHPRVKISEVFICKWSLCPGTFHT